MVVLRQLVSVLLLGVLLMPAHWCCVVPALFGGWACCPGCAAASSGPGCVRCRGAAVAERPANRNCCEVRSGGRACTASLRTPLRACPCYDAVPSLFSKQSWLAIDFDAATPVASRSASADASSFPLVVAAAPNSTRSLESLLCRWLC